MQAMRNTTDTTQGPKCISQLPPTDMWGQGDAILRGLGLGNPPPFDADREVGLEVNPPPSCPPKWIKPPQKISEKPRRAANTTNSPNLTKFYTNLPM